MDKLPHPPPLRLTQAAYVSGTAEYKGGMDRSTLLLQVKPPDNNVSDVDPWYWFSLVLVLVFSLGLVNHIPTHLANK